jgi:hypothetical protein
LLFVSKTGRIGVGNCFPTERKKILFTPDGSATRGFVTAAAIARSTESDT